MLQETERHSSEQKDAILLKRTWHWRSIHNHVKFLDEVFFPLFAKEPGYAGPKRRDKGERQPQNKPFRTSARMHACLHFHVDFELLARWEGGQHDAKQGKAVFAAQRVSVARELLHHLAIKLVPKLKNDPPQMIVM